MTKAQQINIILFEDQPTDAEIVSRYLKRATSPTITYNLTTKDTLKAGLEELANHEFDLILMDQRLKDSDETQTFKGVHAARGQTPIVVLTGLGDDEKGLELVRRGAQDFLVKGAFDEKLLTRVIRYSIERSKMQKELEELKETVRRERELRQLESLKKSFS